MLVFIILLYSLEVTSVWSTLSCKFVSFFQNCATNKVHSAINHFVVFARSNPLFEVLWVAKLFHLFQKCTTSKVHSVVSHFVVLLGIALYWIVLDSQVVVDRPKWATWQTVLSTFFSHRKSLHWPSSMTPCWVFTLPGVFVEHAQRSADLVFSVLHWLEREWFCIAQEGCV